jgi:hypothetical protein
MSRRIVCLALAAATVVAAPTIAAAASQSHIRPAKHFIHKRAVPALGPIAGPVATIGAPREARAGGTTVIVDSWPVLDPAWQPCQLDARTEGRSYFCGPYSYHPFGIYGYRPLGTHRPYHAGTTASRVAPSARIIRIESE